MTSFPLPLVQEKKIFVEKTLGAEEKILRYIRIVCYSIRQHSKPIRILSEVMPGGNILTAPVMQAENDLSWSTGLRKSDTTYLDTVDTTCIYNQLWAGDDVCKQMVCEKGVSLITSNTLRLLILICGSGFKMKERADLLLHLFLFFSACKCVRPSEEISKCVTRPWGTFLLKVYEQTRLDVYSMQLWISNFVYKVVHTWYGERDLLRVSCCSAGTRSWGKGLSQTGIIDCQCDLLTAGASGYQSRAAHDMA